MNAGNDVAKLVALMAQLDHVCEEAKRLREQVALRYASGSFWPDRRSTARPFGDSAVKDTNNGSTPHRSR